MRAKAQQSGRIPPTSKIPTIGLASLYNFDEQGSTHSVPSTEDVSRVGWYLGEVVSHEQLVAVETIPGNA